MPNGIGYSAGRTKHQRAIRNISRVKPPARLTAKQQAEVERLARRKMIDDAMSVRSGAGRKKPTQPVASPGSPGFIKGVISGRQRLLDAMVPKPKKRGQR